MKVVQVSNENDILNPYRAPLLAAVAVDDLSKPNQIIFGYPKDKPDDFFTTKLTV